MAGSHVSKFIDVLQRDVRASELDSSMVGVAGTVPLPARTSSLAFPCLVGRRALQSERSRNARRTRSRGIGLGSVVPTGRHLCHARGSSRHGAPSVRCAPGTE